MSPSDPAYDDTTAAMPGAVPSMVRVVRLGYRAEPGLLFSSLAMTVLEALPDFPTAAPLIGTPGPDLPASDGSPARSAAGRATGMVNTAMIESSQAGTLPGTAPAGSGTPLGALTSPTMTGPASPALVPPASGGSVSVTTTATAGTPTDTDSVPPIVAVTGDDGHLTLRKATWLTTSDDVPTSANPGG